MPKGKPLRGVLPRGMGIDVGDVAELFLPPTYIWRQLGKPNLWADGGHDHMGVASYLPTIHYLHWDASMEALAERSEPRQVWLLGWYGHWLETEPYIAAHFSVAWDTYADRSLAYGPMVPISSDGFAWLDAYLEVDGLLPAGWAFQPEPSSDMESCIEAVQGWMRKRRMMRPFLLAGVHAGEDGGYKGQRALLTYLFRRAFRRYPYLHGCLWYSAFTEHETTHRLIGPTGRDSSLGRLWASLQKEYRRAATTHPA